MSSIAAAGKGESQGFLFQRLLTEPSRAKEDLRRGFVSFKLYQFGEWVQARPSRRISPGEFISRRIHLSANISRRAYLGEYLGE